MASKTLVAASAKPVILALLLSGENYGYRIMQRVKLVTGGVLEWSEAMLYPVLHRLEADGFILSKWKLSEEGRMRKYYFLTEAGVRELENEKACWLKVHEALTKLWTLAENPD
jgi:PadR family transcriptional regulator PadR